MFTVAARVLSVQSHVTRGYVGNKAAVFALQLLGVDVDPLNVVNFSNHTGYSVFRGRRSTTDEVAAIVEGLRLNGMLKDYHCLLCGYVGNADTVSYLATLAGSIAEERRRALLPDLHLFTSNMNVPLLVVCDPVLGDNGKLYVSPDVVAVYREQLVPKSTLCLPNGFEATQLSGVLIDSVASAVQAANWFHDVGVALVVIKSFTTEGRVSVGDEPSPHRGWIHFLISEQTLSGARRRHVGRVAKMPQYFSGTGDLFAALLVGHMLQSGTESSFSELVCRAMSTMQEVLVATVAAQRSDAEPLADTQKMAAAELRLVQCARAIMNPKPTVTCELLSL